MTWGAPSSLIRGAEVRKEGWEGAVGDVGGEPGVGAVTKSEEGQTAERGVPSFLLPPPKCV